MFEVGIYHDRISCKLYRTEILTITEYNPTGVNYPRNTIRRTEIVHPYPSGSIVTTSFTTPIQTQGPWCEPNVTTFDQYENDTGWGYKVGCLPSDIAQGIFWTYDYTYESPVTTDYLFNRQTALESWAVANWSSTKNIADYGSGWVPFWRSGENGAFCTTTQMNRIGQGLAGYSESIYRNTAGLNARWTKTFLRRISWFSKVKLSQNYRVEKRRIYTATPVSTPCNDVAKNSYFGGISRFGDSYSTLQCETLGTTNFSDGFDNGQAREVIFGPEDRSEHWRVINCLQ